MIRCTVFLTYGRTLAFSRELYALSFEHARVLAALMFPRASTITVTQE